MAGENELIIRINGTAKDFLDEVEKVKKKSEDLEKVLTKTAKASAAAFAGFAAVIAGVTSEFADYETALVGVGKTTNIEGKKLQSFGKEFQKLSTQIPLSTNELLGIAQAAGQLGVSGEENLLKFTDTIAKLGVATDLTGEEAATALTRILNVTGESIESIDTFGSVIVQLGNNFAATESEIVKVATEVSRSTAVFGVSASEAAGLATALKSVGVQAQLGGSAVGRAFRAIDESTRQGGKSLENLSKLTGIAGEDLRRTFEQDSVGVFQAFTEGLGRIAEQGGDTTAALAAFGLKGDEILKVLPVLAKNSELVGDALGTAAKEAQNATALNAEAEKAFNTLTSTAQKTGNSFRNLAVNIGEQLAPAATDLLKSVKDLTDSLGNLDQETLGVIASFLKWGAIISGVVAGAATFLLAATKLSAIIGGLSAVFLPATVAASAFWVAVTGPIGIAVAGVAAVTAGFIGLKNLLSKDEESKSLESINSELAGLIEKQRELKKQSEEGEFADRARANAQLKNIEDEIKKLEELKQERIKASDDFGTGEFLVRPEAGEQDFTKLFDQGQDVPIPLRGEEQGAAKSDQTETVKKTEKEKTALVDEATQNRIDAAKRENEALKELQEARLEGATQEELANLERRQSIEEEFAQARMIKNAEEREAEIENLRLKHQQELQEQDEFFAQQDEREQEREELKRELEEELRQQGIERKQAEIDEDLAMEAGKLNTQKEAEDRFARDKLKKKVQERNQFLQDEIKFGTEAAKVKQFFNREEVQGAKNAANQLVQLTQSKNDTLKGIGKAAARVRAAISTAEGAIAAYTSLAGIPIVGPALGIAASAALLAFGVEQQQRISSAQMGGFVPQAQGGARDRVPTLLEPNELVVPSAIAPNFIQSVGNPSSGDFASDDSSAPIEESNNEKTIRLEGDLVQNEEFVSALASQLRDLQEFDNVRL